MQYSKESSEFFQLKVRGAELSGFFFFSYALEYQHIQVCQKEFSGIIDNLDQDSLSYSGQQHPIWFSTGSTAISLHGRVHQGRSSMLSL